MVPACTCVHVCIRGRPFDFWGGVEENVPELSFIFSRFGNNIFYFTMSEKQIYLVLIIANIQPCRELP